MTFPASIANLTKAVNEITAETNVPKSTLDAKVAQAEAETPLAQAQQALAEGYRDEAATHAADAATHLATVQAGVTYQGIEAILAEKAVTAVDVFVYDTSLDSDGGAWRKRCQHTSWYNETLNTATRGARREFPAVAVIVAEAGKVTIYDGDDPALPMWMVFGLGVGSLLTSFNSVSMRNGIMCAGSPASINFSGLLVARFLNDDAIGVRGHVYWNLHMNVSAISARNGTWQQAGSRGFLAYASSSVLVNPSVNDVAMTVLPDAPVDPATGLPVPTIAVATAGGISVIKNDGSIVDIVNYVTAPPTVSFANVGGRPRIVATSRYSNWIFVIDIPSGDINSGWFFDSLEIGGAAAFFSEFTDDDGVIHAATNRGLKLYAKDQVFVGTDKNTASMPMSAIVRAGSTSGWMPRLTRGSFLSDTLATPLVEPSEMVVNGGFDTDTDWGKGPGWAISDGVVSADGTQTINSNLTQTLSPVPGQTYAISVKVLARSGGASAYFYWGTTSFGSITQPGEYTFYRTWLGGTPILYFTVNAGVTITMDDISVVPVDENRSPSSAGLFVNGTITRSPVADGAELVGYSGFSAANYLEQPYNSALDFGTGDFCVMGWFKHSDIASNEIFRRSDPAFAGAYFRLYQSSTGVVARTSGRVLTSTLAVNSGTWRQAAVVRRNGVLELWIDGSLNISGADTSDLTNTSATFCLGNRQDGADAYANGSLALWRISATAPTADQIAKIYEDERKLFQPGAQCTLYGTSDAVTALAHDPKTNLLHVGTSAGRSTFDGLVRVANTTTPVGTAISAVNGLIVEE